MKNDNRQPGYYWVKYISWVTAHYSAEADRWVLPGTDRWFNDSSFDEIDENRIERSEENFKAALYVLSHGGEVQKKSFYDEEGVEGWEWSFEGHEFTVLGSHDEAPIIPDALLTYLKDRKITENIKEKTLRSKNSGFL